VDGGFAHREVVGCVAMGEVLEMRTLGRTRRSREERWLLYLQLIDKHAAESCLTCLAFKIQSSIWANRSLSPTSRKEKKGIMNVK
jgi:hypothetical protein